MNSIYIKTIRVIDLDDIKGILRTLTHPLRPRLFVYRHGQHISELIHLHYANLCHNLHLLTVSMCYYKLLDNDVTYHY